MSHSQTSHLVKTISEKRNSTSVGAGPSSGAGAEMEGHGMCPADQGLGIVAAQLEGRSLTYSSY